jgi:hypothetical protein
VAIELVFETHPTTVDNERGHATGWLPGQLSEQGKAQARASTWTCHIRAGKAGGKPLRASACSCATCRCAGTGSGSSSSAMSPPGGGLDHFIGGVPLEALVAEDFAWQEGWEYRLS